MILDRKNDRGTRNIPLIRYVIIHDNHRGKTGDSVLIQRPLI